jgi:hypothetical protein
MADYQINLVNEKPGIVSRETVEDLRPQAL